MRLIAAVLLAGLCVGCGSSVGQMDHNTATGVTLSKRNYKAVKTNAKGESGGFWLLGLIPFWSPTYSEAKERLYDSVGEKLSGRAIALANQTEDHSFRYFILFALPKLTLTADVVEFTDTPSNNEEPAR